MLKKSSLKCKKIIVLMLLTIIMMVFSVPEKAMAADIMPGTTYIISPKCAPNKALDIAGGSTADGANCQIYTKNNTDAQIFVLQPIDDCYIIYNYKSEKALDVDNAIAENGRNVQQYSYNGTNAQKWWIEKNADGTYTFVSHVHDNYVLDISNAGFANGTNVQIWQRNGSDAQKFYLYSIIPVKVM